ncbi:glycosyltransferase family 1 protein [Chamaesiphon sp. OTE_8_metabat_110]|uniref:glycosyltransferase family 4 protein n=1 Tax=Chamaesiphon sp. OTE_8_metabat_110 TaxID=2964696 RepID=UPI00286B3769|nr:glycosyltransferase family 1 protein [Chamaesiphon sp. OTE_8_metabat_110]
MHILVVALHRPIEPTGVCRHAANLTKCLVEKAEIAQVTVVTGTWQQGYFQNIFFSDEKKIEVIGIDIENTSWSRNLWFLFGLPKLAKQLQPDLIHLSFPLPLFKWFFDCPIVATIHDLYPYKIPENFGRHRALLNRLFLWQCIGNSNALVCVSQTTLDDLNFYFPRIRSQPEKAQVIYNYVDFERIEPKSLAILEDQAEPSFILCVGQHRKNKNIDLLIQSYALLQRDRQIDARTKLVIVGSIGPETEKLKQSIEQLELGDAILLLSAIDDRELCWLYQKCRLFVIPSTLEGFCIPLVEALYFSCQVVCSDIPVFREIGSSSCIYFDLAGDPVANMAQSIGGALAATVPTPTTEDNRFTKTQSATQYLNLYLTLRSIF